MPPVITAMLCAVLLGIAIHDLRSYRIENKAVLATVLLFSLGCLIGAGVNVALHGMIAAVVFVFMIAAFHLGLIGGGDAKLLVAAFLWIGPQGALVFALGLFGLSLAYAAGALSGRLPSRRLNGRMIVPFGPCIAGAWIVTVLLPFVS